MHIIGVMVNNLEKTCINFGQIGTKCCANVWNLTKYSFDTIMSEFTWTEILNKNIEHETEF